MGGVGKIFKSVASFAFKLAPAFMPGGSIFGMASKLFSLGTKVLEAGKELAPKLFNKIDQKFQAFRGLAFNAFNKANAFLNNVGNKATEAAAQATAAAPKINSAISSVVQTTQFSWLREDGV